MIQTLIFDLDDTLLDTSGYLIPVAQTPEFERRIREPLPLIPGALETLQRAQGKFRLLLLTQGDPEVQKQKLASLNIEPYFNRIYLVNLLRGETKALSFLQILKDFPEAPSSFLSIGNRLSTDVRGAKFCGMKTCLFRYGEHIAESAIVREDIPDFEIQFLGEIFEKCHL